MRLDATDGSIQLGNLPTHGRLRQSALDGRACQAAALDRGGQRPQRLQSQQLQGFGGVGHGSFCIHLKARYLILIFLVGSRLAVFYIDLQETCTP